LFYARIALERAEALGRQDWVASTHNHIGNVLLAESFVDEAHLKSIFNEAQEIVSAVFKAAGV
jgi:phosphoglucomutase